MREGSGPPLSVLHGWPGLRWEWNKVIGQLAENYDVIVPDLRGFGDSEKPDLADLSKSALDRAVDDQAGLLDALGIDEAYVGDLPGRPGVNPDGRRLLLSPSLVVTAIPSQHRGHQGSCASVSRVHGPR